MNDYTLQVYEDGAKLVDNRTNKVIESFPKNDGRFNNPAWESYLNKHWNEMKMNYDVKYMWI